MPVRVGSSLVMPGVKCRTKAWTAAYKGLASQRDDLCPYDAGLS